MSVISTHTVTTDLERASRTWIRKTGIVISCLITAFLAFDAAGKLAAAPQVKEGTQALGSRRIWVARSRPICASSLRC
jgi:hypothetical protein